MSLHRVTIVDPKGRTVVTAEVTEQGGHFAGLADLRQMSARHRKQFEEFEEHVNNQLFGLLDQVEEKIEGLRLRVVFGDGQESDLVDVQIYPSTKKVSFKVAKQPVGRAGSP